MEQTVSWIATAATIIAACLTASNLGPRITGYGFIVFTIGSIAWFATGLLGGQPALMWTNVAMTGLNLFGVWRWLGRQTGLQKGAETAAERSESTPGEALFPASVLGSAKLVGAGGAELGSAVDAMIRCGSGRIDYLVIAEGGVGGVGERFRRLDWGQARVDEGRVRTDLDEAGFARLPDMARDSWPGR